MKSLSLKTLFNFISFVFICLSINAQNNTPPLEFQTMNNAFTSVSMKGSTSVAVATNGAIMYSTDKGETWKAGRSNYGNNYVAVSMADSLTGWAVGNAGLIVKTTNGGATWTNQTSGATISINNVFAINPLVAYACGGGGSGAANVSILLRTTDGGVTWTSLWNTSNIPTGMSGLNTSGTTTLYTTLYGMYFSSPLVGYVVGGLGSVPVANGGGGKIAKTTDGGGTWTVTTFGSTNRSFRAVHFADDNNGWVVGNNSTTPQTGQLTKTTDGGVTWSTITQIASTTLTFTGIIGYDVNVVFACNQTNNIVYRSTDGGTTFSAMGAAGGISTALTSLSKSGQDVLLVGGLGEIFKNSNLSPTWGIKNGGRNFNIGDLFFINANNGWAACDGKVMKTTDGGTTWTEYAAGTTSQLQSVVFINDLVGFASGPSTGAFAPFVTTSDGGLTWTPFTLPSATTSQFDISFPSSNIGYTVGTNGTINRTINAGTSWSALTSGVTTNLQAVHFINDLEGWAVGLSGTVIKTSDGGASWFPTGAIPASWGAATSVNLYDVWFADSNNGYIAGGLSGKAAKTTDGGTTWTAMTLPSTFVINDMEWKDINNGILFGTTTIQVTKDGGTTWTILNPTVTGGIGSCVCSVPDASCEGGLYFSYTSPTPTINGCIIMKSSYSKFYIDADGDGYGAGPEQGCWFLPQTGYSSLTGDCNDADNTIYPNSTNNVTSSIANGEWQMSPTWDCGIPLTAGAMTNVLHNVNVSSNINLVSNVDVKLISNLTIKSGYTLTIGSVANPKILNMLDTSTLTIEAGAKLIIHGQINTAVGTVVNNEGELKVIN